MKNLLITLLALIHLTYLFGQKTETASTANYSLDVSCYNLQLQVIPQEKKITGKVILHVVSLERISGIFFELNNAVNLESAFILKRLNSWDSLSFTRMADKVSVVLPKSAKEGKNLVLQLNFTGVFNNEKDTLFNWNTENNLEPFIKNQPKGKTFYWWPCIENQKADSMALSITIPKQLSCCTLGNLKEKESFNDHFETYKWMINFPVEVPNIPLFIGNYKQSKKEYQSAKGGNFPVEIWQPANSKANEQQALKTVFNELAYLETKLGPYPRQNLKIMLAKSLENYDFPTMIVNSGEEGFSLARQWFHPYLLTSENKNDENMALFNGISNYTMFLLQDSLGMASLKENMAVNNRQLLVQLAHPGPYAVKTLSKFYTSSLHTIHYYLGSNTLLNSLAQIHSEFKKNKWKLGIKTNYITTLFQLINKPVLNALSHVPSHPDSIPQLGVFYSENSLKLVWKKPKDFLLQIPLELAIGDAQHKVKMTENRGQIPIKQGENFKIDPTHWFLMKLPEYKLGEPQRKDYTLQDYFSNNPWLHSYTENILLTLTDSQKVAQMIITSGGKNGKPIPVVKDLVASRKVGGVIFLKGNKDVFKTVIGELNALNKSKKGVPLIYSMDAEPSLIKGRLTGFPETIKTIEIKDTAQCRLIANQIDSALLEIGVRQNFAPVCDVSPNNEAISNRSFGNNIERVKEMALSYIQATQQDQVIATAKHFPGHGMVKGDTHKQSVYIDGEMKELEVYEPLIEGEVISIMVAHIVVKNNAVYSTKGLPSSCSKKIITDLLKDEMGFEGLVVSDALNIMKAVTIIDKAPLKASMAGCDFILMPQNEDEVIKNVLEEMAKNPYYKQRVYDSVKKIIRAKICLGLF